MIDPFKVLFAATTHERIEEAVRQSSQTLMKAWREVYPGKDDHYIYRDMMVKCGWKYDRKGNGSWSHVDHPGVQPPGDLNALAKAISRGILRDSLNNGGIV